MDAALAHDPDHTALQDYGDAATCHRLLQLGQVFDMPDGAWLCRQYWPAQALFVLLEGELLWGVRLDDGSLLELGTTDRPGWPVGWSLLREPHRYALEVRCSRPSRVLRLQRDELENWLARSPQAGAAFLQALLQQAVALLDMTRGRMSAREPRIAVPRMPAPPATLASAPAPVSLLRRSAFLEVFDDAVVTELAAAAQARRIPAGLRLHGAGSVSDGLCVLGQGEVVLMRETASGCSALRTLDQPGQIIDWSVLLDTPRRDTTALARRDSLVYVIPAAAVQALRGRDARLECRLLRRALWLVANHLRSARARLAMHQAGREMAGVRTLIAHSRAQLPVQSPLHQVPVLLEHPYTRGAAFQCLETLCREGNALERSLASMASELLARTRSEQSFFEGLLEAYRSVVEAPQTLDADELRARSAAACTRLFSRVPYRILGRERLPDTPGHVFILNHRGNHPSNVLANGFELTLDTHFVSALILQPKYGDPGIRVVRRGRGEEFAHQSYYDRLDPLYVYTEESDTPVDTGNADFYAAAGAVLRRGRNLVLCPEGTSTRGEQSLAPLRPGAFRLAAGLDPEPLVVPVAMANFDRRPGSAQLVALIGEPFRVSSRVDVSDRTALRAFLASYRHEFGQQVAAALRLSAQGAGDDDAVH